MTVESVTYITDLDASWPLANSSSHPPSEGDDHIRAIKTGLAGTFASFTGAAVTATEAELNILDGDTADSSVTLAATDQIIVNDAGTMKQTALSDLEVFIEGAIDTLGTVEFTAATVGGVSVATLGANTFTGNQTLDKTGSNGVYIIDADSTNKSQLSLRNGGVLDLIVTTDPPNTKSSIQKWNAGGSAVTGQIDMADDGTINVSSGTFSVDGTEVATLGANTFTADQTISNTSPVLTLNDTTAAGKPGVTFVDSNAQGIDVYHVSSDAGLPVAGTGLIVDGQTADALSFTVLGNIYAGATAVGSTAKVPTISSSDTLTNKTLTSPVINTGISGTAIKDEDNMSSNSATHLATQQSIKAYVDNSVVGRLTDVKTADEDVNNSATLQNDNHISLSIESGYEYAIEGMFIINSAASADFKFDTAGTATLTNIEMVVMDQSAQYAHTGAATAVSTTGSKQYFMVKGSLQCNGSGTFILQWAQNTAVATITRLYQGSYLTLHRSTT